MAKKSYKNFLLDVDSEDEQELVSWIESDNNNNKNYYDCGCCDDCLCDDNVQCKNCGCSCNYNEDDDSECDSDDDSIDGSSN